MVIIPRRAQSTPKVWLATRVAFHAQVAPASPGLRVSSTHGRILGGFWLHLVCLPNPEDVVTPDQNLAQCARADAGDEFLGV